MGTSHPTSYRGRAWPAPSFGFLPLRDLPGVKYAWHRGDELGAQASQVATWPNLADASNAPTQSVSSAFRPTVDTIGGKKCGLFDGADDKLIYPTSITKDLLSYFAVVRPTTIPTLYKAVVATKQHALFQNLNSGTQWGTWLGSNVPSTVAAVAGVTCLLEIHVNAVNNVDLGRNGVANNRTNGTVFAGNAGSALGSDFTAAQYADMRLFELFICDVLTNPADRLAMRAYLNTKYGIF